VPLRPPSFPRQPLFLQAPTRLNRRAHCLPGSCSWLAAAWFLLIRHCWIAKKTQLKCAVPLPFFPLGPDPRRACCGTGTTAPGTDRALALRIQQHCQAFNALDGSIAMASMRSTQLIREQAAEAPATQANALQLELTPFAGNPGRKPLGNRGRCSRKRRPPNPAEWEIQKRSIPPATCQGRRHRQPIRDALLGCCGRPSQASTEDPFQAKASIGDHSASGIPPARPTNGGTPSALDSFTGTDSFHRLVPLLRTISGGSGHASDRSPHWTLAPKPIYPAPLAGWLRKASTPATAIASQPTIQLPGARPKPTLRDAWEGHPGSAATAGPTDAGPIRALQELGGAYCIDEWPAPFNRTPILKRAGPEATVQPPAASWPLPHALPSPSPNQLEVLPPLAQLFSRRLVQQPTTS